MFLNRTRNEVNILYWERNGQEPYAWLRHSLERLPAANRVEDYEALLPWNCPQASSPAS